MELKIWIFVLLGSFIVGVVPVATINDLGELDLTVLRKSEERILECHGRTNAADMALVFQIEGYIPKNETIIYPDVSEIDCFFGEDDCSTRWTVSENWKVTSGSKLTLPPANDYSWQNLKVKETSGVASLEKWNTLDDTNMLYFSVSTSNDVHLFLSARDTTGQPNYYIIIGGWYGYASAIRKCENGRAVCAGDPPTKVRVEHTNNILTEPNVWKHFWISFNNGLLQVGFLEEEPFLEWRDPQPLKVTHYSYRAYFDKANPPIKGYWKFHWESKVIHMVNSQNNGNQQLVSHFFDCSATNYTLWWHSSDTYGSLMIDFKYENNMRNSIANSYGPVQSESGLAWQKTDIYDINGLCSSTNKMFIRIYAKFVQGSSSSSFIAIRNIRKSGSTGASNVIQLIREKSSNVQCVPAFGNWNFNDDQTVGCYPPCRNNGKCTSSGICICQPGFRGKYCTDACPSDHFGNDCLGRCRPIAGGCSKTSICSASQRFQCKCASGYVNPWSGASCSNSCGANKYGPNCELNCGQCLYGTCDKATGYCRSCNTYTLRPPYCKDSYFYFDTQPLEVTQEQSTSINMTIQLISRDPQYFAIPTEFVVQYKMSSSPLDEWMNGTWYKYVNSARKFVYTLSDLKPGTSYLVRPVVKDEMGNIFQRSDTIPTLEVKTTCKPHNPPRDLVASQITSNSSKLSWSMPTAPTDGASCGNIQNYNIHVLGFNVITAISETIDLINLQPFENYTWRVQITYSGNSVSEWSETAAFRTEEGAPTPVVLLSVTSSNPRSLNVQWRPPSMPNGIIRKYIVKYELEEYTGCKDTKLKETNPSKEYQGELEVVGNITTAMINDLWPYATYKVSVAAQTTERGDFNERRSSLPESVPLIALNAKDPNIFKKQIKFSWEEPKCYHLTAPARYKWILSGLDQWDYGEISSATRFTKPSVTTTNRIPFSTYLLKVWLTDPNDKINETLTLEIQETTLPGAPPGVVSLEAYQWSNRSVSLRWKPPYPTHGKLEKFKVYNSIRQTFTSASEREITLEESRCILWDDFYCFSVESLTANTLHYFWVSAFNTGVPDEGSKSQYTVETNEKAPDAPTFVNVSHSTNSSIFLHVGHPDKTNGILTKFVIQLERTDGSDQSQPAHYDITYDKLTQVQRVYEIQAKGLTSASAFDISVFAETNGGRSSKSVKARSAITLSTPPTINGDLVVTRANIQNGTITLKLPSVTAETNHSSWIVIASPSSNSQANSSNTLFRALPEAERYILERFSNQGIYYVEKLSEDDLSTGVIEIGDGFPETDLPLKEDVKYDIALLSYTKYRNMPSISWTSLSLPYILGVAGNGKPVVIENGLSSGIMAAVAVLVVLLMALGIVAIYIHRRRQFGNRHDDMQMDTKKIIGTKELSKYSSEDELRDDPPPDIQRGLKPAILHDELINIPANSTNSLATMPSERASCPVKISQLKDYVEESINNGLLKTQFQMFPRGQTKEWNYGKLPQNKPKNRYGNLIPYDESRVLLERIPDEQFSDYINANYVDGYTSNCAYIATQGPKQNTVDDFWRMIWQENTTLIVMLTNLVEKGKNKCERYWPAELHSDIYGEVVVMQEKSIVFADFTFHYLIVAKGDSERKVIHAHFTSWPDHGVPWYPQTVATFAKKLILIGPGPGPIVIHCSAGVGRTGTLILIDSMLKMAAAETQVDCVAHFQRMREQRANLVDNFEQYTFVHLTLVEILFGENVSIPCDKIANTLKKIMEIDNSKGCSELQRQLDKLEEETKKIYTITPPSADDLKFVRDPEMIPGPHTRVYLQQIPSMDYPPFLNATYVDGFHVKDRFITTQHPLPTTVAHFWQMIYERKSTTIIGLQQSTNGDKHFPAYYPTETNDFVTGVFKIDLLGSMQHGSYATEYNLLVKLNSPKNNGGLQLRLLQFHGWPENQLPSEERVVDLYLLTERVHSPSGGPVTLVCHDGATGCGLMASSCFVLDKLKLEQEVDAFLAVKCIRQSHPKFVNTLEQYTLLHKLAISYLDNFQTYANFQ